MSLLGAGFDLVFTVAGAGGFAYTMGMAKSFIDRHPDLKELGWSGAIMWPVLAGFGFVTNLAKAGYKTGMAVPFDPQSFMPPPTANALMPGKEDDDA